jgi:ribA/ribD-fused uncharacterized protein
MGGTAGEKDLLRSCYTSALALAAENKIRRLAFCSISTGELGYPVERAAKVAVATVCDFVKKNPDAFDDICWVVPDDLCLKSYSEEIKAAVPKKKPVKKAKASEEAVEEVEEVEEEAAESEEKAEIQEEVTSEKVDETAEEKNEAVEETVDNKAEDVAEDKDETGENPSDGAAKTSDDEAAKTDDASETVEGENAAEEVESAEIKQTAEETAEEPEQSAEENEAAKSPSPETTLNLDDLKYWNLYDINWLISEEEQVNSHRYVCFWHDTSGSDNSILSSWHAGKPITINGRTYATLEQYIISEQALLFGDFDSYKIIMDEPDPQKCKKAGRNIKNYDENKWRAAFKETIFRGAYMRALCDEEFAGALLATGEDVLIEASPFDDVYGAGMKESELITPDGTLKVPPQQWRAYKSEKQSENILGFVLMGVRDYLRKLTE